MPRLTWNFFQLKYKKDIASEDYNKNNKHLKTKKITKRNLIAILRTLYTNS